MIDNSIPFPSPVPDLPPGAIGGYANQNTVEDIYRKAVADGIDGLMFMAPDDGQNVVIMATKPILQISLDDAQGIYEAFGRTLAQARKFEAKKPL